jgi:hypothetical protein
MIVYHELDPDTVDDILKQGIRCSSTGSKTDDAIQRTDELLDSLIPPGFADRRISRQHNLYAYLTHDGAVIDITDGQELPAADFLANSTMAVVSVEANPSAAYVSDIDAYDRVKEAIQNNAARETLNNLASDYWSRIIPLEDYQNGSFRRPEVMITYDVPPEAITLLEH